MTEREALKLARTALGVQLDALLGKAGHLRNDDRRRYAENGIKAIDEALAQPEQEPVAWYRDEDGIRIYYETKCWDDATPLYTAPQPWEKFCDSNCVWTDHHPDCKLAEQHQDWCASLTQMLMSMPPKPAPCNCKPKPEPMAWTNKMSIDVPNQPLYTPPQRKPLTDEQKKRMWVTANTYLTPKRCYLLGIEDAEYAHNIKG